VKRGEKQQTLDPPWGNWLMDVKRCRCFFWSLALL